MMSKMPFSLCSFSVSRTVVHELVINLYVSLKFFSYDFISTFETEIAFREAKINLTCYRHAGTKGERSIAPTHLLPRH
jgi:hypothetical protein